MDIKSYHIHPNNNIVQDPFTAKISEYLQHQKTQSTSKPQDLQHTVSDYSGCAGINYSQTTAQQCSHVVKCTCYITWVQSGSSLSLCSYQLKLSTQNLKDRYYKEITYISYLVVGMQLIYVLLTT